MVLTETYAAIFDLDGVLTETHRLHYRSWDAVAAEFQIPFDTTVNDRMRGISRPQSLAILLEKAPRPLTADEQAYIIRRKNDIYLELVDQMTPADLLPGVDVLLDGLAARGLRLAVASSSRNAERVCERLGLIPRLDVVVDANTAPLSKPDPQVFLAAAARLGVPPTRCVVFEDAEAGVAAAQAGGMRVIGIGPAERVGAADVVVAQIGQLDVERVLAVFESPPGG